MKMDIIMMMEHNKVCNGNTQMELGVVPVWETGYIGLAANRGDGTDHIAIISRVKWPPLPWNDS